LPSWLSVPVLICSVLTVLALLALLIIQTDSTLIALVLGLVPLAIVFPVLSWLDRVEPEPLGARIHALLWGATVAGFVSLVVNTAVGFQLGETWAAVVSAPIIEEITKGLGIYWALRRREVDGVMDGIVYAGWVALGFACIEDVTYFANAAELGNLAEVFVIRALLTPFAHPLFSAWIGLAIGLAVARRQSVALNAAWGLGLAIASHATWNATLIYTDETGGLAALAVVAFCFVALFVAAAITVVLIRRSEQRQFVRLIPLLAQRHGLTTGEVGVFGDWQRMLATRRALPRSQRDAFDRMHAALARLALFHRRGGDDPGTEQMLSTELTRARIEATGFIANA
jgi:RsiW-degrading membrane proteinase PrsW (M82 family)